MSDQYRLPTSEEKLLKSELIGRKVSIFWDGDDVFYPGTVTGYDAARDSFSVVYDENSSGEVYTEDFKTTTWKLWCGTDEEYAKQIELKVTTTIALLVTYRRTIALLASFLYCIIRFKNCYVERFVESRDSVWRVTISFSVVQRENLGRAAKSEAVEKIARDNQPISAGSGSSSKMSYTAMVTEAITVLADRHGSSIQAVRKYVTNHFPLKPQQAASFNSLTLKALNKAVALEVLEYDKRLYRLSAKEKDRRRDKEKAMRNAASAASRDAFSMVSAALYHTCFNCGLHFSLYISPCATWI
jgi:hypothetical protein